jgi:hypothetical protein
LALLYNSPDEPLHVRQIVRLAGLGLGPTQRELLRLARLGVLKRQEVGRQVLYRVNPACPVCEELRGLVLKTFGVVGLLRRALLPFTGEIRVGFLFGSFAQGDQKAASDIDVFIVGDTTFTTVARALAATQRQLKREINPVVYRPAEFAAKWREGHPFVSNVMASPKTFLVGDENDLSRVAEEWLAETASNLCAGGRRPARRRRTGPQGQC